MAKPERTRPAIVADKSKPRESLTYITVGIAPNTFKDTTANPAPKRRK